MRELQDLGMTAELISGDQPDIVEQIAGIMGIDWQARVTPSEKNDCVVARQQSGHRVLMVGDGLNDGPALKAAHVAMAPAAASDVGQMSATSCSSATAWMQFRAPRVLRCGRWRW